MPASLPTYFVTPTFPSPYRTGASIEAAERELGWPEATERQQAAGDATWDAWHSLLGTRPDTLAGLLALVKYAAHHDDGDGEELLEAIETHLAAFVTAQG